jgi:predicted hydrolase (HD superfamily)
MISRDKALEILHQNMKNQNLRRHCYAVEAVMRALARKLKTQNLKLKTEEKACRELVERWGIVGLLHDGDYEKTKDKPDQHTLLMHQWLKEAGETDKEILEAILSHNYEHTGKNFTPRSLGEVGKPKIKLEWSLYCCDELTGFIVACALVMPDKKLASVKVDSVLKKMKDKSFAAAVKREQIQMCEEKLKIPLKEFVKIALGAMQGINKELGL